MIASASISALALGTITYAATASPLLTAVAMFGGPLIQMVGSSFLLSLADLLRPRTAMILVTGTAVLCDAAQAWPHLPWGWRFALMALPWLVMSATSGTRAALMSEILPASAFVLGRSTLNIAVGVMQVAGYGLGGLLLAWLTTTELFLTAGALNLIAVVALRLGLADHPPRGEGARVVQRTRQVNRILLSSSILRPIYLCLWIPNGLVVGCEALFVPFAGDHAGYLFAVTASGMLFGDVVVGRFVPESARDRLVEPLRLLLAIPYLACAVVLPVATVAILGLVASVGYAASLPLQERLVRHSEPDMRGQVLGLANVGMMVMQAVGAALGGLVGQVMGSGTDGAARAMSVMAALSLAATVALTPGLRRSHPARANRRGMPT